MNRREVLELLVQVYGIRDPGRLRRLTREYLAYQGRRISRLLRPRSRAREA